MTTTTTIAKAAELTSDQLARYIDHTILKPESSLEEVRKVAEDGVRWGVAAIMVNPASLDAVSPIVRGTQTGLAVVCDFPFGQGTTNDKQLLARNYCERGDVKDIDFVINYSLIRAGRVAEATADIAGAIQICKDSGVVSKVIIETDALSADQIADAVEAVIAAGGDYVKTSTGFYTGGPTVGGAVDVMQNLIELVAGRAKVKASAHIRTREHFLELVDLGVDRIGLNYTSTPKVLLIED